VRQCTQPCSDADVLIDEGFKGDARSIRKVPVGKPESEIQLSGNRSRSIPLILEPGTGIRSIRASLEQKE
jgi:hypothetical protein